MMEFSASITYSGPRWGVVAAPRYTKSNYDADRFNRFTEYMYSSDYKDVSDVKRAVLEYILREAKEMMLVGINSVSYTIRDAVKKPVFSGKIPVDDDILDIVKMKNDLDEAEKRVRDLTRKYEAWMGKSVSVLAADVKFGALGQRTI